MGALASWVKGRKTVASGVAIAVLAGVPLSLALFHQGFPVTDVDLNSQNVWVTNGEKLLGGRLNHQIGELDAKVNGSSKDLDVLQDGGATLLTDATLGTVQVIDPAFVSLTQKIQVPIGSRVAYGKDTIAVLAPDGRLWVIDGTARLSFDPAKTPTAAKLGSGSQVTVSKTGRVFAVSKTAKKLYTVDRPGSAATSTVTVVPKTFQLSAVGEQPVVLDTTANTLMLAAGKTTSLGKSKGLRLQQAGPENSYAIVATGSSLIQVPLDGSAPTTVSAKINSPVSSAKGVSSPVFLGGCSYGAWSGAQKYLYACDGKTPIAQEIDQPTTGNDLEFRVNHGVIALNNLQNGNAWIATSNLRLVNNWAQVNPDQVTKDGQTGKEKPVKQSFADALANRTATNHPPVAVADNFGARPGRTTILPVLDNDTDQDGDVLTISAVDQLPAAQGVIDVIQGGRALQYTPADGNVGGASFQYTITDGRQAFASAPVNITIRPLTANVAPAATRSSITSVEVGQSIQYNVLNDWNDPDGDDLYIVNASPTTPDSVQFTPDGHILFTSKTGQTGAKQVTFTVSDGHATATGSLEVNVMPAGSMDPVAVPDFAQTTVGAPVTFNALANDLSPSGAPLSLVGAKLETGGNATITVDQSKSTIGFQSSSAGSYYLTYTLAAGSHSTTGLALVVVTPPSTSDAPPVAVKDIAYVRPGEPTTVAVLANDVSPSGRVLVVQSVNGGPDTKTLNVELLNNTTVRITASGVLAQQVQLTYTVSDGAKSATAGITVVPIPPLVNHQSPIANDDTATVRAGDIATVHVLDNDSSPDNEPFTLDPTLASTASQGSGATSFVSGSFVRYQAPTEAGTYSVSYGITDKFGQHATATVNFVVTAKSGKNRAPEATTLTGRAFAGASISIVVPLDGIDPDGDSVTFDGIGSAPSKGRVSAISPTSFTYEAYVNAAGTDSFSYRVEDTAGKQSVGTINIGVVPRPSTAKPPTAVDDKVQIKPGKTAAVPVLLNDSDPNGYTISLLPKLGEVQAPLVAKVSGSVVLLTAPTTEGAYLVRYQITNGQGGTATAYIQVLVTKDAKPVYPTAADHVIDIQDLTGKTSIKVDALDGATNPSGVTSDLTVAVKGVNASAAVVGTDSRITVTPGEHRMAITYSLTDPTTGLAGQAFIVVPPKPGSADASTAPPQIKPGLNEIVKMNGTISFTLANIIDVPSGRGFKMTGGADTNATNSNGSSPFVNAQQLTFTPAKDYRGPAAVTFRVNDGRDPGTTADRITLLTLPITVGSADQSDVPPTFTPPTVQIIAGEGSQTIDLRSSTYQPNPAILSQVQYSGFSGTNSAIVHSESGSSMTLSAPFGTQPGVNGVINFTVSYKAFSIPGSVNVQVVSSKQPLAQQKNPPQKLDFQRGTTNKSTLSDAVGTTYWINPFPNNPLTILGKATLVSAPNGVQISNTGTSITVTAPTGSDTGAANVQYTVQDVTKDPSRNVTGVLSVTIHDVPDAPPPPSNVAATDAKATMTISAPANTHGLVVDHYEIRSTPTASAGTLPGEGTYTATGLTNGTSYSFQSRACNSDGCGAYSPSSTSVTPYGTPDAPTNATITNTGGYSPTTVQLTWTASANTGDVNGVRYMVSYDGGAATQATSGTTRSATAGTHSFTVYAINGGGKTSGTASSNTITVVDQPPPPPSPSVSISRGPFTQLSGCNVGCYFYHVSISGFAPGPHTVELWCDYGGASDLHNATIVTTYQSENDQKTRCGMNAWAIVEGVSSPHVSFHP